MLPIVTWAAISAGEYVSMNKLQEVAASLFQLPPFIVERAREMISPGTVEDVRIFSVWQRSNTDSECTFPCRSPPCIR